MNRYTIAFLLITYTCALNAQQVVDADRFDFESSIPKNSSIPSPEDFLGYELGEEYTLYSEIKYYYRKLAEASPRVLYNEYGKTYEGRPLINLIISSEDNIQNIETIRETHLRLLDPSSESEELINNSPVFTSLSYNIHGNEASTSEAAMQVAYRMAASTDDETKEILQNSVIIMYVCINPDGRDRFVYWYKSMKRLKRPSFEPMDIEQNEAWPWGRTNHYLFDLNRDWIWGVHPESRGHIKEYQKWMPQVHADYHEQGSNSNYFTMPGTTPRNQQLPDQYESWTKVFGDANIDEFDKHQINYFTRDRFDFFYAGYGSSWPSIMGSIGMLTEQGSSSGRMIKTDDGYVLTLRQGIFDHYTTSIATIKTAASNKEDLLRYSHEAWKPSNSKVSTKAYFFDEDNMYSNELVRVLKRNGVKVYQADDAFQINSATNFRTGNNERKRFDKGTFIVPTDQSRNLFITSIMERNMKIEDSVMYDMSTWSAPIAYNIDTWSTNATFTANSSEVVEMPENNGEVTNSKAQYAYVIDWTQRDAPKALSKLWEKGYNVRAAFEPFGKDGRIFPAGSLIILKGRNREKSKTLDDDILSIANDCKVEVVGFNTGRMDIGMDLANTRNRPIKQPKVALMVDLPFNTYTSGQIYFLFDWQTELPIERIRTTSLEQTSLPKRVLNFRSADLNNYDVLILPGGGSGLRSLFGEKEQEKLREWISKGGTIIATENASTFFTKDNSKLTNLALKKVKKDSSDAINYLKYSEREDYYGKKRIPGAALNGVIDTSHPLAFGLNENLYTLKFGTDGFIPTSEFETVGYYSKDENNLLVAGYASKENLGHLKGLSFAAVKRIGSGKIVYLIDNTQYRMFWLGPSRMMQNAVMILPGF